MSKIVVIGSINEDITLSVDDIVAAGNTIFSNGSSVHNGGKGANQAVSAVRMSTPVSFVGTVGNDGSGKRMVQELKEEGIDVSGIQYKDEQTGYAMIQVDSHGKNAIIVHKGANHAITKEDIDHHESLIKEAAYCLLQFEIPMDVIHYIIEKCHEWGVKVVLNPAPFVDTFDRGLLHKLSLFVPNEHEFMDMMHITDVTVDTIAKYAKEFYETYQTDLIVTLGEYGSYYHGHLGVHHQEAFKVNAVDTTAAGDSFIGALTAGLVEGKSIQDAMALASKVSSITVTKQGAQPSIPYRKNIE